MRKKQFLSVNIIKAVRFKKVVRLFLFDIFVKILYYLKSVGTSINIITMERRMLIRVVGPKDYIESFMNSFKQKPIIHDEEDILVGNSLWCHHCILEGDGDILCLARKWHLCCREENSLCL